MSQTRPVLMLAELPHSDTEKNHVVNKRIKLVIDIARWMHDEGLDILIYGKSNSTAWQLTPAMRLIIVRRNHRAPRTRHG